MKRIFYICVAVCIGLLLGVIMIGLTETWWITNSLAIGRELKNYALFSSANYLPPPLSFGLLAVGFLFGLRFGFWGWRVVYVEKRHWSMKK